MNDIIPRDGIVEIVGHRDHAVALYEEAFEAIRRADEAVRAARSAVRDACGGDPARVHADRRHAPEIEAFENAVQLPDGEQYLRVARRLTDIQVWSALIERTELQYLMDKKAKDDLRKQMSYIPERVDPKSGKVINEEEIAKGLPPVSVEVVEETLRGLVQDAGTIWRRGIANAFSELDRRFRSHDGFKIGSRVILSRAFDEWGTWNYYRNHRDTLTDIERVFLVLDGKGPRASYAGIIGKLDEVRRHSFGGGYQSVVEGDYFRVRVFKNGNAHLWFTRDDLVRKVNRLLAEYYGEVVADGKDRAQDPETPLENRAVGHAKNFGLFPTPDEVAEKILDDAWLHRRGDEPPLRCLEPSAGTGVLAERMAKAGHVVDVVEVQPYLAKRLESGPYARVMCRDFLAMEPEPVYDRIVMNPPFDRGRDVDHVAHAVKFLRPGGVLVAIMAAGVEFREDAKTKAFRTMAKKMDARWRDLPSGSFSEHGTNVNTLYVKMRR